MHINQMDICLIPKINQPQMVTKSLQSKFINTPSLQKIKNNNLQANLKQRTTIYPMLSNEGDSTTV